MAKFQLSFLLFICSFSVFAQDVGVVDTTNILEMSLESLMDVQVTVASKTSLSQKESPGIVSVVTETDIKNSGARDMIDVLRLIPGIDFGTDVQGVVGISMRGNWGHEGKVALIVDGQEMNELLFSTTYFGNRFDVSQIKRIEIIRGPGSSIYGGNAELGVINMITKSGEDLKGAEITATAGQLNDTYGRRNLSLAVGDKQGDFKWSVAGFLGHAQRTNQDYKDFNDSTTSLTNKHTLDQKSVNVGLAYKNLSARWVSEDYVSQAMAQFTPEVQPTTKVYFKMNLWELKYAAKLSKKITLTPKLNYTYQRPWNVTDPASTAGYYPITASKFTQGLHLNYDVNDKLNFIAGGEVFEENAHYLNDKLLHFKDSTSNTVNYYTVSGYVQGLYKSKIAVITAGIKAINHNKFGAAFAPRIGITKSYKKFHGKILYNSAFRAPSIENINYNANIKPEITNVFEVETGYKINDHNQLTVNVFDITINRPIVYIVNAANPFGTYMNFDKTGTQGLEGEYKIQYAKFNLAVNYSYYMAKNNVSAAPYQVPDNQKSLIGMPNHKAGFVGTYNFSDNFSVTPSGTFLSEKYAVTGINPDGSYKISLLDSKFLFNLNLRYKNLFTKGLEADLGVYDLFDQKVNYVQAYKGGLGPLPGTGREIVVRISYALGFHKN